MRQFLQRPATGNGCFADDVNAAISRNNFNKPEFSPTDETTSMGREPSTLIKARA
ncbi:MAG: hypothetical protein WDM76_06265 [Limisphaerales bacterium]